MPTTATVQFAVNYAPLCFKENASYSVLSKFIIIKSVLPDDLFFKSGLTRDFGYKLKH